MVDINAIRDQLNAKKEELVNRIGKIDEDLQHRENPPEKDFAELATERENDEVLEALLVSTRQELKQINKALVRMDEGSYLECSMCGEDIPEARLKAVPYTTHCVKCAERNQ